MGRIVINETENKQTVILNDSPEGVSGGYFDSKMNWHDMGSGESSFSIPIYLGAYVDTYSSSNYFNENTKTRSGCIYLYTVNPGKTYKVTVPENETNQIACAFYTRENFRQMMKHQNMTDVVALDWNDYTDSFEFTVPADHNFIRINFRKSDNSNISDGFTMTIVLKEE